MEIGLSAYALFGFFVGPARGGQNFKRVMGTTPLPGCSEIVTLRTAVSASSSPGGWRLSLSEAPVPGFWGIAALCPSHPDHVAALVAGKEWDAAKSLKRVLAGQVSRREKPPQGTAPSPTFAQVEAVGDGQWATSGPGPARRG